MLDSKFDNLNKLFMDRRKSTDKHPLEFAVLICIDADDISDYLVETCNILYANNVNGIIKREIKNS